MSSEAPIVKDETQMIAILQQALAGPHTDAAEPIDDEMIALLVEGGIQAVPPSQRDKVPLGIAGNPQAAELVQQLTALRKMQHMPSERSIKILRFTKKAWALAACLMIGLFVSRLVVSTKDYSPDPINIKQQGSESGESFPYPSSRDRGADERARFCRYRDKLLWVSTGACLMLSTGLVVARLRQKHIH